MKFKTIVVYFFATILAINIGKIAAKKLDNRPIKFENYDTYDLFEQEMRKMFFNGSNIYDALKILHQSNAECVFDKIQGDESAYIHPQAEYMSSCIYFTSIFSLDPRVEYRVVLHVDKNFKIVYCSAMRLSGFLVI